VLQSDFAVGYRFANWRRFTMSTSYEVSQPERSAIDAMPGTIALEFGTGWCGYCRAAEPLISAALADHPAVRHMKVEDGSGRPLGRSFRVKLWPTVVVLKDGKELARVVRPADADEVREALAQAEAT
jgi:thioredoxin 1